ncbi:MAG: hypothetical protein ABIF10_05395 [Candidatus Woesearchaeota archaeon]
MRATARILVIIALVTLILSFAVGAVSCHCHAGGDYNYVCLYTTNENFNGNPISFDLVIRNMYHMDSSTPSQYRYISNVATSLQSCVNQNNQQCGSNYFSVSINPATIPQVNGKMPNGNDCNADPQSCSRCSYGSTASVSISVTNNNAPAGTYTLVFRTRWDPKSRYRDLELTWLIEGGSCTNQCTSGQQQCVGTSQFQACTQSGGCWVWGAAQNCPSGQTCSNGQCGSASHAGDLNADNNVNIMDLILVAQNYGMTSGFDPRADANGDNKIGIQDLIVVAQNYGWKG